MISCQFCPNRNDPEFDCAELCQLSTPFAERNERGEILFFTYEQDEKGQYVKHYCSLPVLVNRLREQALERLNNAPKKP